MIPDGSLPHSGSRLFPAGSDGLTHVPPKRRRRIRDLLDQLLVGPLDVLPKVEAGNIGAPASLARVGNIAEDAGEVAQAVLG